jgi:hypothetical protein
LDKQYGAGDGHFELHACMHPLTVFGNPILDKLASSSHALLILDVPEINHPAHCNKKIFHLKPMNALQQKYFMSREAGIASDAKLRLC